jgi:DNA-3-methyladenine glycosylase
VAPDLLNKLLVVRRRAGETTSGRIVEVEAYDQFDPASHTFVGPTRRNAAMFGPAGHLYVYLSYGIHHCANVVTGEPGVGSAVLIRAVSPVDGLASMRRRRGVANDRDLSDGPGKVCQALAIDLADYGADLTDPQSAVTIVDDGVEPPADPRVGPRVGISKAVDTMWRFRLP